MLLTLSRQSMSSEREAPRPRRPPRLASAAAAVTAAVAITVTVVARLASPEGVGRTYARAGHPLDRDAAVPLVIIGTVIYIAVTATTRRDRQ